MTTQATPFRSFILEPFELAIGQPHQVLISSASVSIVALEAATLIPFPANVALAVGAEWAYLRGLISGHGIKTRWAPALNWSAVLLVVLYGSLWGFRQFNLISPTPPVWAAVLLTLIHIGAIGAVTICSAMLHRVGMDMKAADQRRRDKDEEDRQRRLQDERDKLALELERKRQELAIWQEGMEAKARLKMQSVNARTKMQRDAHQARLNADDQKCPKCGIELDRARWLAARRWGYCAACKEN